MESKVLDLSGEKPIEYKVLSIDEKYGTEEKFRSIHLQGKRHNETLT